MSCKGFAMLEGVLAMALFALLAGILSQSMAQYVRIKFQHALHWQHLQQQVDLFVGLDAWVHAVSASCLSACGCFPGMTLVRQEQWVDRGIHAPYGHGDVLQMHACLNDDLTSMLLFVAQYRGMGASQWGLYTQIGQQPRRLLLRDITSLRLVSCQTASKGWENDCLQPIGEACKIGLLQFRLLDGQLWQQVMVP